MKTKVELPWILWRGRKLQPEIVITKNRKTSHVRWSIYTMDNDYVLSETLASLFLDVAVREKPFLPYRDWRRDRRSELSPSSYLQGCLRWGGGRYLPHEMAESIAAIVAEIYVIAMEHCAKHQEAILAEWEDWRGDGRKREKRPKIEWQHLTR